jgi:hypothetical protein
MYGVKPGGIGMSKFSPGDTLYAVDGDAEWTIEDVRIDYVVSISTANSNEEEVLEERLTLPQSSLVDKLDYGDLVTEDPTAAESDGDDGCECPYCGDMLETVQGRASHVSQVHETDDDGDAETTT